MFTDFHPKTKFNTLTSPSNTSGALDGGYISSVFRSPTENHVYLVSCNTHTEDKRELNFEVYPSERFYFRHNIEGLYGTQLDHIEINENGTHIICPDGSEFYLERDTDLKKQIPSYIRIKED